MAREPTIQELREAARLLSEAHANEGGQTRVDSLNLDGWAELNRGKARVAAKDRLKVTAEQCRKMGTKAAAGRWAKRQRKKKGLDS